MMLSLIVALDQNGLIGRGGGLPWHLPADLKHFKAVTMGKPVIMGRKTYASIGRPLPGRQNMILTRQAGFTADGCEVFSKVEDVMTALHDRGAGEAVVIGGADIYRAFMPQVRRMYITLVDGVFTGDTWFPAWPPGAGWHEKSREKREPDDKNMHTMAFIVVEKLEKI